MNASAFGLNKVAAEWAVCVASKRKFSDCIGFKLDYLDYKNLVFAHRVFLYGIKNSVSLMFWRDKEYFPINNNNKYLNPI